MKKTAVFILSFLVTIPLYSAGYFYFRSVTWGMSPKQAEEKIKWDYRMTPKRVKGGLEFTDQACGHEAKIYFKFYNERLYSIVMTFAPDAGQEKALKACVLAGIEKKYGKDFYAVTAEYYRWEREATDITADFGNKQKFIVTYTDKDVSEEILKEKEKLLKEKMGG